MKRYNKLFFVCFILALHVQLKPCEMAGLQNSLKNLSAMMRWIRTLHGASNVDLKVQHKAHGAIRSNEMPKEPIQVVVAPSHNKKTEAKKQQDFSVAID